MEIKLTRKIFTDISTIGELSIDGEWHCYTLEDKDRGLKQSMNIEDILQLKVKGKTCIPYGRYEVIITPSVRFKKDLPLLLNVPGFVGIRIHSGNTAADTEGCLLPGLIKNTNYVGNSRVAFNKIFPLIKGAINKREAVFINITK